MENYTSDSSDSDNGNKVLDFSRLMLEQDAMNQNLELLAISESKPAADVESIILSYNQLSYMPESLVKFSNLKCLDISSNGLTSLPDIFEFCSLSTLIAKNNNLTNESLPKTFTVNSTLRELNLSGNQLSSFPEQVFDFCNLKYLYLGGNQITSVPRNIWKLTK